MMGKDSKIEWTDHTWNPWVGCSKVSAGCDNCYMFRDQKRFGNDPTEIRRTSERTFNLPKRLKEPSKIFVCSWSDFFHEDVPKDWRRDAWEIMFHAKNLGHQFLILTKRPENIHRMLPVGWIESRAKYWPHIWLGVTAENQEMADLRIPILLDIPAKVRFVSCEPLIGLIEFDERHIDYKGGVQWVITGGESGADGRWMDLKWARVLKYECQDHGIPFFMKQMSGNTKALREAIPEDLMIREFPK